jgi:hypothetical protein
MIMTENEFWGEISSQFFQQKTIFNKLPKSEKVGVTSFQTKKACCFIGQKFV